VANKRRNNREFRNFAAGVFYSLCIALALFLLTLAVLRLGPEIPQLLTFARWSGISDALNLIVGLPIAFAGAYVAISIASRTQELSEKQQSQQDHHYYEQLHEQLIDNYFGISRSADQLVSAANRFQEAFLGRLRNETSSGITVLNFIDEDHRRHYIQKMLEQNRDGISDMLHALHEDIRVQIQQLLEMIDLAFKHAAVNETWKLASSDPKYFSLLSEACRQQLCGGAFEQARDGHDWLLRAKDQILERLDLHHVQDAIVGEQGNIHPMLPYCLYIVELQECRRRNVGSGWDIKVLLAGYFLMTHASKQTESGRVFFNSGALFLMDLIHTLPGSEQVRLAFSYRHAMTEAVLEGSAPVEEDRDLHAAAVAASRELSPGSHHLFAMLSRNIQFGHYSARIRKTRQAVERLLAADEKMESSVLSLLQIRYEHLQQDDYDRLQLGDVEKF